jgi:transposase InsO family protein
MPWKARSIVGVRKELVMKVLAKELPIAELCREYGVSRKTAYKWLKRFREQGLQGLVDESRRPDSAPIETTAEMTLAVLDARKAHPTWGPKKLHRVLLRRFPEGVPSERTIARVLSRSQMTRKRKARRPPFQATEPPRYVVTAPNDLWTVDFKGWWTVGDGKRCEPLTVRDAFSRYVLALKIMHHTGYLSVRSVFEDLFKRYGLPKAIQSDNGQPFASVRSPGGLTRLSSWWVSLGIELVRGRPGCPQDNGGHERMHADIRVEIQLSRLTRTLEQQQAVCDEWITEFNHVRPHEAIGGKTPSELYRPSPRRPGRIVIGGFPDGCKIVRVGNNGRMKCRHGGLRGVYVSTSLRGHQVGLRYDREDDVVQVWFFNMLLGTFVPGEHKGIVHLDFETCYQKGTKSGNAPMAQTVTPAEAPIVEGDRQRQVVTSTEEVG